MHNQVSLSPLFELRRTADLMDRLFEAHMSSRQGTNFGTTAFVPIDVWEEGGTIFVKAAVPGIQPEDIEITLQDGVLTLSGEMRQGSEGGSPSDRRIYVQEFQYGAFTRSIRLPDGIDDNEVDAEFSNGFLTVRIPRVRPTQAAPKRVQVRQREMDSAVGSGRAVTQVQDTRQIPAENREDGAATGSHALKADQQS